MVPSAGQQVGKRWEFPNSVIRVKEINTSNNREKNNNLAISPVRIWVIGYNTM